jgi:hypothetical protein
MSELSINTTQNVKINFKSASAGERIGAYFLDLIIKIAYGIVVSMIFFYWLNIDRLMVNLDTWSRVSIVLFLYFPIIIY